jgi:hypothetical protein
MSPATDWGLNTAGQIFLSLHPDNLWVLSNTLTSVCHSLPGDTGGCEADHVSACNAALLSIFSAMTNLAQYHGNTTIFMDSK